MKKVLYTHISQFEVKALDEKDAPETYAKNLPPQGKDKWQLVEFPDGKILWTPKLPYTFGTPQITDHTKVQISVKE